MAASRQKIPCIGTDNQQNLVLLCVYIWNRPTLHLTAMKEVYILILHCYVSISRLKALIS